MVNFAPRTTYPPSLPRQAPNCLQLDRRWGGPAVFYFLLLFAQLCNSDFNVVIPEICHLPPSVRINLTWIHEMVHLGIRDETSRVLLNILGPEEICDGSEGLLKFISMAYSDPSGTMIGSLEPHFCPTAAAACQLKQKTFISWTCPKIPGVISLKPENSEVIGAVQRLITYFNWKKVAFVKSRVDTSSFCDELGIELQDFFYRAPQENVSVVILGNYEDLDQMQVYASIATSIDNLFLCVSYAHGLRDNMFNKEGHFRGQGRSRDKVFGRLPLVLLPEWPLPMDIFGPEGSTLGLVTNQHPFPPSSATSYESKLRATWSEENGVDPLGQGSRTEGSSSLITKMIESLLAQMILKSVRIRLEINRNAAHQNWGPPPYYTTEGHGGSHGGPTSQQYFHHPLSLLSFYFSLAQFEQGRWHPLINLSNGDKPPGRRKATEKETLLKTTLPANAEDLTTLVVHTWVQVLIAVFLLVLFVVSVVGLSLYARHRSRDSFYGSIQRKMSRRQRNQGPYKILLTSKDIVFGSMGIGMEEGLRRPPPFNCTVGANGAGICGPEEKPDLLKVPHGPLRKNSSASNLVKTDSISFPGDNKARYKGDLVHLRKLGGSTNGNSGSETLTIKMKGMSVLENLNGLRHENVAAMLGCLTEPRPALVWEYCSRGSLYEILQQNDIKLDWAFKLSLLTDLVRGMRYLHLSFVKVHGSLTSHNCVVDARWVLKITDYGLNGLYAAQGLSPIHKRHKELLWTAPELLRDENLRKQGTQGGDVYSFAIIMQEVLVRGEPYCMITLTASEILEKLKHPPPLIRPSVSKGVAPPEAINIMRQCWAELPDMRPDFIVIHDLFKTLNHGRKANIVDTMFQMLEKYSNNLEELIRERTEQLDLEKKKTEQLLNRMLPSMVADKLKVGLPVDPEEFSDVTIYFSDIVGFTTFSAYSTPFEVVDLLNDLYTCFDATINDYNVYKVETIGDAYMVVGGAPVWSKDHADQIATMALDLLHQSGRFRIRHLPFTPLRLRIGLHTGSCCAGVVGLTMPRYCLFGDTVNTASRMESTGAAWRIHISGETKAKLDSIGGYIIQYRGMTAIKGKGQMPTFWLMGKEGFDKELPKPPGPNDSCHLDEKAIIYGRTGVWPEAEIGNEFADPTTAIAANASSSAAEGPASANQRHCSAPPLPKAIQKYGLLHCNSSGSDTLRSLSPAEQVAHQLLTGKPAARGLRRQFSLDQGTNTHPLESKASVRRAPSLEESSEYIYSNSCSGSFDRERAGSLKEKASSVVLGSGSAPSAMFIEGQGLTSMSKFNDPVTSAHSDLPSINESPLGSTRPILKTRTLTILEESPVHSRKSKMIKNNSAHD